MAVSALHAELPRCRGAPCRTRAQPVLQNDPALGAEIGTAPCARSAAAAPRPGDRWHLDEMVVRIAGRRMYLWRAVDQEGEILDILVQSRRDRRAAVRLMRKLLRKQGFAPKLAVTDKLPSYAAAFLA